MSFCRAAELYCHRLQFILTWHTVVFSLEDVVRLCWIACCQTLLVEFKGVGRGQKRSSIMVSQPQPTVTAVALCNHRDRRALWRMRGRCSACCEAVRSTLQGGFSLISRLWLPAAGTAATWIRCIAKWKSWSEIFTAVKVAHWNRLTQSPENATMKLFILKP